MPTGDEAQLSNKPFRRILQVMGVSVMRQRLMLRISPEHSRRKRFRDKKRYFKKLQARAEDYELYREPDMWWDFHHEHLDYDGRGNLSLRYRRQTLRAHQTLFRTIASQVLDSDGPFQLWLNVANPNAINDAVYLHSRNPQSDFPCVFDGLEWNDDRIPQALIETCDPDFVWGAYPDPNWGYVAFKPEFGLDLRAVAAA